MRKGILLFCLLFCLFFCTCNMQASNINLKGIYVLISDLNLEAQSFILEESTSKNLAENYIYQMQNSLSQNAYLLDFQANNNLEIMPYYYDKNNSLNEKIVASAWEKQKNAKDIFILSFQILDYNKNENIFRRIYYKAVKLDKNRIELKMQSIDKIITYNSIIPFADEFAPSLQNNSNNAPIVGKYIAQIQSSTSLKKLQLHKIIGNNSEKIIKELLYKSAQKDELYFINFYANNNIKIKAIYTDTVDKNHEINIGQWLYIDHENYEISFQITEYAKQKSYEFIGYFNLYKNTENHYTLSLQKNNSKKEGHQLLYYYTHYFNRLQSTEHSYNTKNKIIGYFTHHEQLDLINNYLPIALEQHNDYAFAEDFAKDISKKYAQVFHFKADNTIEIIDIFNNNPSAIPSQAFWYSTSDKYTYIIKYKLKNNDTWYCSLYTFKKEDISSFVLEKWDCIALYSIISNH